MEVPFRAGPTVLPEPYMDGPTVPRNRPSLKLNLVPDPAKPPWRISCCRFQTALNEGGPRASTGLSHQRMLGALVILQIALALILLTASGLMIRSFIRLTRVNPGFVASGLLAAEMERPDTPANRQESQLAAFYQQLVDQLADLPSVESVCAIDTHPMGGGGTRTGFTIRDEASGVDRQVIGEYRQVTDGYFRCMRIPLLKGRFFTPADRLTQEEIVLINREFAERYMPEEEPVGKTVTWKLSRLSWEFDQRPSNGR